MFSIHRNTVCTWKSVILTFMCSYVETTNVWNGFFFCLCYTVIHVYKLYKTIHISLLLSVHEDRLSENAITIKYSWRPYSELIKYFKQQALDFLDWHTTNCLMLAM